MDSAVHNAATPSAIPPSDGIQLATLPPGTILQVQTRNTVYTLIPQPSGEVLISGHAEYCPVPTLVIGLGATSAHGFLREGYLMLGARLSFPIDGRRISTSRILAIQRLTPLRQQMQ